MKVKINDNITTYNPRIITIVDLEQVCQTNGNLVEITPNNIPLKLYIDVEEFMGTTQHITLSKYQQRYNELLSFFKEFITDSLKEMHSMVTEKDLVVVDSSKYDYVSYKYTKNKGVLPTQNSVKISFHFLCCKVRALKKDQKFLIELLNMSIRRKYDKYYPLLDTSVYTDNRKMRLPNQSKDFENRPFRILQGAFHDCVITNTDSKALLIEFSNQIENDKKHKITDQKNYVNHSGRGDEDKYYQMINELLTIIQEFNQRYDLWLKVGMCLHTEDDSTRMKHLFYEWSNVNYPANMQEINYLWNYSFKKRRDNPLKIYTLRYDAKNHNETLYTEWYKKWIQNNMIDLIMEFDAYNISNYFYQMKPNNYIYKDGKWYGLQENNLWVQYDKNAVGFINDIAKTLKDEIKMFKNSLDINSELLKLIPKLSRLVGSSHLCYQIIDFLKSKYTKNEVIFDEKWHLFGFNNKVYDLKKNEIRNYCYDDYVTITCGYDYVHSSCQEIELVKNIICKIQPNEELRDFYLSILCSGLEGKTLQHFIVFNGSGGNGKSMMNELYLKALGDYGHTINNIILCETRKSGACTDIANLNNKRFIIAKEPPNSIDVKFSNSIIKELTGGSEITARKLYTNDDKTKLRLTLICECNKKPNFQEEPTHADVRRLIDLYFPSRFTKNENEIDHNNNIYEANDFYTTEEFKVKYRNALLQILFDHYKKVYQGKLVIPELVKKQSEQYLENSFELFKWFNTSYDKLTEPKYDDVVTFYELYKEFKDSEFYYHLNKNERKRFTRDNIIEIFKKNPLTIKYFREPIDTRVNGIKFKVSCHLFGFKKKPIETEF